MTIKDKVIFLDTSVFESENYFEGRNINILFNLAKEELIHLKVTDIVYREILNRIQNHAVKAVNIFKKDKLNFEREARILRNTSVLSEHFERVDFKKLKESAKKEIQEKFYQIIAEFNIEIVDSSVANIKEVLNDYFDIKPPFRDGVKKTEFPDAFSLNTIKVWCQTNKKSVIHLSNDKDFTEYDNKKIDCSHDLSSLLEHLFTENSDVKYEFISAIFEKSIDQISDSVESELSEDLNSLAFSKIENDAWSEDVDVDFLEIYKTELVIGVINEIEEDSFSYEIEMNLYFSVEAYYTDLSTAFYDKEDGVWWGEERREETKKYCANALLYADFELEDNKIDGHFYEITDFEIRDVDEI